MKTQNRIEILDGLRVVAILMVMLFHFYPRFDGLYFEYSFGVPKILNYGHLGVQLFFIISGFVITLTLTKCKSFSEFMKKRFIRLIPGMFICSTVTFILLYLFDTSKILPMSTSVANWVLSNTFISPDLFNMIFNTQLKYIDGAYWSLWVELQFYVVAGVLYFMSKKNLLRNYAILTFISVPLWIAFNSPAGEKYFSQIIGSGIYRPINAFFTVIPVFRFSLWFLAGIITKELYFGEKSKKLTMLLIFTFVLQAATEPTVKIVICTLLLLGVFLVFIYKQNYLLFLSNKWLTKIGLASYSIYLIHENVGLFAIINTHSYFGALEWLLPLILIVLVCLFGLFSYKYFENPLVGVLKKLFFRKPKVVLSTAQHLDV